MKYNIKINIVDELFYKFYKIVKHLGNQIPAYTAVLFMIYFGGLGLECIYRNLLDKYYATEGVLRLLLIYISLSVIFGPYFYINERYKKIITLKGENIKDTVVADTLFVAGLIIYVSVIMYYVV